MKQLLIILFFLPTFLYSQSEGGFGFRRFANTTALTSTSVNNSDKNASRRAYVHSTGLYYRWNGSAWAIEETIDTFSVSGTTLRLSILNDGVPAKTVDIAGSIYGSGADSTWRKNNGTYLGKRITDAVNRTGPTGIRSGTDTTGVLNIYENPAQPLKPLIRLKGVTNTLGDSADVFMTLQCSSDHTPFIIGATNTAVVTAAGTNVAYFLTRNLLPGGGRFDTTETGGGWIAESDFINSHPRFGNMVDDEYHIVFVGDSLGNVPNTSNAQARLLSFAASHNMRGVLTDLYADAFYIERIGGTLNTYQPLKGDTWFSADFYGKTWNYQDTIVQYYQKPQVGIPFMRFRSADDSRYWEMFRPDATDRLVYNPEGNNLSVYGNIEFPTKKTITTDDGSEVQIGSSTKPSFPSIYAPATQVLKIQSVTGGSNVWNTFVNSNNMEWRRPDGTPYATFYTNAPQLIAYNEKWGFGKSPGARLDLKQLTDAVGSGMAIANSTGTSYYWSLNASGDMLWWHTGGSQRMMLTQSGDLLLGTSGSPARKLHVVGEARITDLTTDTPTRIVGADADGDLGGLTVGTGLTISGDSLKATGGSSTNIYNSNGTTSDNTRNVTVTETLNIIGTADITDPYPFQVKVTGNEPRIQLWKGNTDSVWIYQSDVEYHFGSSTVFQIESNEYLNMVADSITVATLATKTKIQNIVGISNGGTLQQIEGTSGGQVLTWNASGYWELGTGGGAVADGDYGDITVSSSGTVWTIDAGVVSNSKIASGAGGIYKGSGTIASGTVSTLTAASTWRVNYSGATAGLLLDDTNNAATISGASGTYAVSADNTSAYMTGALSSTFTLGSTGGTTLTASVANTNTVNTRETIITNSSGTAATGLGTGTLYQLETSTTNSQDAAEMDVVASDATHASRTFDFVFKTVASANALTEAFRIGGTTYALTATASVSNTNTVANRLIIKTNSTGTPSTSFGGSILFQGESSTTDNQDMAKISSYWTTATHASRTSKMGFSFVNSAGAITEQFTMSPSGLTIASNTNTNAATIINTGITATVGFTITAGGNTITLGNGTGSLSFLTSTTSTVGMNISVISNAATETAGIVFANGQSYTQTSGTRNVLRNNCGFAPTSGTAVHNQFIFDGTFNQTGGANGITRGIYLNQTLTAVADFRGLEIAYSNSSAKGIYQTGSSTTNNFVGATGFGATTAPTDKVEITGNLALLTAGNKIKIATGSNASAGKSGAMTAGSITISTTAVTSNSLIFLTHASVGGTQGILSVGTITAGTSFVINSSSALDTSTVNWWIIN